MKKYVYLPFYRTQINFQWKSLKSPFASFVSLIFLGTEILKTMIGYCTPGLFIATSISPFRNRENDSRALQHLPGYSHSGLEIGEYTEYQFTKERISWKQNIISDGDLLYLRMRQMRWHGEKLEREMLKCGHKYQFFGGSTIFRFNSGICLKDKMTKNFLYLWVLCVVQDGGVNMLGYKGLSRKPINAKVISFGQASAVLTQVFFGINLKGTILT